MTRPEPSSPVSEHSLVELVLREDGGVALTCGRGTDTYSSYAGADPERTLIPVVVLGRLAQQVSGYQRQWAVGVLLDDLKGVSPYDGRLTWGDMGYP